MEAILLSLGINLASSTIYDWIKSAMFNGTLSREELTKVIANNLKVEGADIAADKIISFAAKNGDIIISGTTISSGKSINMSSGEGTSLTFGNNSVSATPNTKIEALGNSKIVATGNARIVQNEDGSIDFFV